MVQARERDEANDFLMGGGGKSASFLTRGTRHEGEILAMSVQTQRDINTGMPKSWNDGSPMKQLVVQLQTDEVDEDSDDDDGVRNLYVKFKMRDAIKEAVKAAGAAKLEIGGWLAVEYVSDEKPKKRGHSGAKVYEAEYEAPDPSDYLDEDDPDEDDAEPEPPARPARKAAAKKAPAKAAPAKAARSRRAAPEPEPEDDDDDGEWGNDGDGDSGAVREPAPRRGRAAKAAPAKATRGARGRTGRAAAYEDDNADVGF